MEKLNVLFLCTGNSCRSQMAEAFVRKYAGDTIAVYSAGLDPRPVHEMAIEVMKEVGIDISGQRSKPISEFLGKIDFRYVIFVCEKAEQDCPYVYPHVLHRLSWPFDDPATVQGSKEIRLTAFRNARDSIEKKIKEWIPTIHLVN
ncbi:MAG: arsenate reductase ArsC [Chitinivibrionales bacterium]